MAENNEVRNDKNAAEQIAATPAPAQEEKQATKAPKKPNKFLGWCKEHKFHILAGLVSVITGILGFIAGILFERNNPDPVCDCDNCDEQEEKQEDWYDLTPADQTKETEESCKDLDFPNSQTEEPIEIVKD